MSAASRQGSTSYVVAIAAVGFVFVGALVLTFIVFPITNAFTGSPIFQAETGPVGNLTAVTSGLWTFWPFILLVVLTIYIWVETRQ